MKKLIIKIIQIILIIFPIILLPLSFMFCITNEHLMFVNNSNRDEIISFIGNNSNIDFSEKNIVGLKSNDRFDYYQTTLYFSDGSKQKIDITEKSFEPYIKQNSISGTIIASIFDLFFIIISITIIFKKIKKDRNNKKYFLTYV